MQMSHWQYYIGDTLFAATLIAKNWRIYRIFFNKELEQVVSSTTLKFMYNNIILQWHISIQCVSNDGIYNVHTGLIKVYNQNTEHEY